MKKIMYLVGFLGSVSLTVGVIFRLLNFQWGYEFFLIGFIILLLIFIPLFALEKYKISDSTKSIHRLKIVLGGVSAIIAGLSGVFKLMHLQGTIELLILGALIFVFGFLPLHFFSMYKKSAIVRS